MTARRRTPSLALVVVLAGCTDPNNASTGSETGDAGGLCPTEPVPEFFEYSISIDGLSLDVASEYDIETLCDVEGSDGGSLTLDCVYYNPEFTFELTGLGAAEEAILDVPGNRVGLRFVRVSAGTYANTWLRLDFWGAETSVFMIDADTLEPTTTNWLNPWALAVGQECVTDPAIDQRTQSLTLERNLETLEVWQGESATLDTRLEVWVDRSLRSGSGAPAGDGPPTWKKLVLVSRGHLVLGEACEDYDHTDKCWPGLLCCRDCVVCVDSPECTTPVDMQCPPIP